MAPTQISVRAVGPEDEEAVLELSRDIYGGVDYMRSLFHVFLQDPRCYCYLAEVDGQVISFYGSRVMEDDKTVYSFGGRSALGYEGIGALTAAGSETIEKITADYPGIRETQGIAIDTPRFQKALGTTPSSHIMLQWVYHSFNTDANQVRAAVEKCCHPLMPQETSTLVSYSKNLELIPQIEKLLCSLGVLYLRTRQIFPGYPQRLSSASIRQCLMNNDVVLTNNTETNQMLAVTIFCSFINNSQGPVSVFVFYGKEINHFKQHIEILLKHVQNLVEPKVNEKMAFVIHFPVRLDEGAVEEYLTGLLGRRLHTEHTKGMTGIYLVTRSLL